MTRITAQLSAVGWSLKCGYPQWFFPCRLSDLSPRSCEPWVPGASFLAADVAPGKNHRGLRRAPYCCAISPLQLRGLQRPRIHRGGGAAHPTAGIPDGALLRLVFQPDPRKPTGTGGSGPRRFPRRPRECGRRHPRRITPPARARSPPRRGRS